MAAEHRQPAAAPTAIRLLQGCGQGARHEGDKPLLHRKRPQRDHQPRIGEDGAHARRRHPHRPSGGGGENWDRRRKGLFNGGG